MPKCIICNKETKTEILVGEHGICLQCEKTLLSLDPENNYYAEMLNKLRPFAKMVLCSFQKEQENAENSNSGDCDETK